MEQKFKKKLDEYKAFSGIMNNTLLDIINTIPKDIPKSMAMTIAIHGMSSYLSAFHYKIKLGEDNLIPVNVIAFILAKSGMKKTSTVRNVRNLFKQAYDKIDLNRWKREIERASVVGESPRDLNPMSSTLGTEAGFTNRIAEFMKNGIGMPSLYVDEVATELDSSEIIVHNIKLIGQLFDNGDSESKPLRDSKNQLPQIKGMGVPALFIGSEYGILEQPSTLKKFDIEFMSKLSRRSFFAYPEEVKNIHQELSAEEVLDNIRNFDEKGTKYKEKITKIALSIARMSINKDKNLIEVDKKAKDLIDYYMLHNKERAKVEETEMLSLEVSHREWKVFKLAGIFAVFNKRLEIKIQDIIEAISVAEMLDEELKKFNKKSKRLIYEMLIDHLREKKKIKIYELIEKKWIRTTKEIEDLVVIANSKIDEDSSIVIVDDEVIMNTLVKTKMYGISYKRTPKKKEDRRKHITKGYKYIQKDFKWMKKIMENNTAYCIFEFKDGVRNKNNLKGTAQMLVLDVDDSNETYREVSDFLADYEHIICTTSDNSNPYKYRLLLPTNIEIDVPNHLWTTFLKRVSEELGVKADLLAKAQIFYGFKSKNAIYQEGEKFDIRHIVKNLPKEKERKIAPLVGKKLENAWKERYNLFRFFYEESMWGKYQQYHNSLWLYTRNCAEKGLKLELAIKILYDIVEFRFTAMGRKPRGDYLDSLIERMETYDEWREEKKDY